MMVPKFRAWEERYKKYIDGVLIDCNGKVYFDDDVATQDDLDISVEQSAGLKDVNGKEIYENDIVKVFAVDDFEDYYHAPIKYWIDDNYPAFDIDRKYVPSARWYDANILSTISESGYEKMEVIGNVNENPELLEAQHG